jgi:hypothetical protein
MIFRNNKCLVAISIWSNSIDDALLHVDSVPVGEIIPKGSVKTYLVKGERIRRSDTKWKSKGSYQISIISC